MYVAVVHVVAHVSGHVLCSSVKAPEPGCAVWYPILDAVCAPPSIAPGSGCRPSARREDGKTVIALLHTLLDVLGGLAVLALLAGMIALSWLPDAAPEPLPEESRP